MCARTKSGVYRAHMKIKVRLCGLGMLLILEANAMVDPFTPAEDSSLSSVPRRMSDPTESSSFMDFGLSKKEKRHKKQEKELDKLHKDERKLRKKVQKEAKIANQVD